LGRLKHIALFALICSNFQIITAQQNNSPIEKQALYSDETVFISTNATTFITGETLYYKLDCLKSTNKTPSNVSKIAYVALIDSDKKTVFKSKLYLENGIAQGDYFMTSTIKTGKYKLIGYTIWMLNKTVNPFFQIDIIVFNPFQTPENTTAVATTPPAIETAVAPIQTTQNTAGNNYLKLNVNKKTFTNRDLVTLNLSLLNEITKNGNYSISVRKQDDLPTNEQITAEQFSKMFNKLEAVDKGKKIILPELRGEMITGKISCKTNPKDIENINIGFSIPGVSFGFKTVKTDKNGNFIFNLDKPYNSTAVNIQVIGDKRSDYSVMLDNPTEIDYSKLNFETSLNISPSLAESLLNRSIASQIENAYYSTKTDSIQKSKPTLPFYETVAKEYVLDDYTRFPTLKETAIEIVKEMYYDQKDKNYTLHLRDVNIYTQSPESALVLIDGLLIQNANELFEYNMKNIQKISIVPGQYYLGPKAFNGVISFTTKTQDYTSAQSGTYILDTALLTSPPKKEYFTPDYTDKTKNARIPDYRYQLLWLPQLKLVNRETPVSFYTSDVTGTFEIKVEGFTDQGIPISLTETFEVQ
jgi:hypothetical protein